MLRTENLFLSYGDKPVVQDISLAIPEGGITCLLGPNGSGKSTLLKSFAGLLPPQSGQTFLDGRPVTDWNRRQLALRLAMLPQKPIVPEGIKVRDLVALGRFPHRKWWQGNSTADDEATTEAMTMTGVLELAERPVQSLSGGQQQRAWIAMALAQGTQILLLDEPTANLDAENTNRVEALVNRYQSATGAALLWVSHDTKQLNRTADTVFRMIGRHLEVIAET